MHASFTELNPLLDIFIQMQESLCGTYSFAISAHTRWGSGSSVGYKVNGVVYSNLLYVKSVYSRHVTGYNLSGIWRIVARTCTRNTHTMYSLLSIYTHSSLHHHARESRNVSIRTVNITILSAVKLFFPLQNRRSITRIDRSPISANLLIEIAASLI